MVSIVLMVSAHLLRCQPATSLPVCSPFDQQLESFGCGQATRKGRRRKVWKLHCTKWLRRVSGSELINTVWGVSTCRWKTEQFACTMPVFPASGMRHKADQCHDDHCREIGLSPPGLLLYMTVMKAAMQRPQLQLCFTWKSCNSCCHAIWLILTGTQQSAPWKMSAQPMTHFASF